MIDTETSIAMDCCDNEDCVHCPWKDFPTCLVGESEKELRLLKSEKKFAETQLKELLSALYRTSGGVMGFTLYRKDIVELAEDYGIKEEELK